MNLRRFIRAMPKWVSDLAFVLFLIAAYLVASIFVLPRLGFET